MVDPIEEIKTRARLLHRRVTREEPLALARVAKALATRDRTRREPPSGPYRRRHCLDAIACELGFRGYVHALRVLSGEPGERDFGTMLYVGGLNVWCAAHDEAAAIRDERAGYLLPYRHHFLVVDRDYVAELGLDPDDPDWAAIGFDWAKPRDRAARRRLYGRLFARLAREMA